MSWVELALADVLSDARQRMDEGGLARRLGVTRRAVRDAFSHLVERASTAPDLIKSQGMDPSLVSRVLLNRVDQKLQAPVSAAIRSLANSGLISYQSAYPKLKNLLSSYENKSVVAVQASDRIDNILKGWAEPDVREDFQRRLEQKFVLDLGDKLSQNAIGKVETVRDLAKLVVQKSK